MMQGILDAAEESGQDRKAWRRMDEHMTEARLQANLQLVANLEHRGALTTAQAQAERLALRQSMARSVQAQRRAGAPQARAHALAMRAATSGGMPPTAINGAGAAPDPLQGMLPGRPLTEAGLDPYSGMTNDGMVSRDQKTGKLAQDSLRNISLFNPDASGALHNWQRLCLPDKLEVRAMRIVQGRRTDDVDEAATEALVTWMAGLGRVYGGGMKSLLHVQLRTLVVGGAIAGELELSDDTRDIVDVHPVSPFAIDFRADKRTGKTWWVYAVSGKQPVALNPEQFTYIPLDPELDRPHGVSMFLPALETHYMLTEVMRSFVRAAKNQGWARLGVKVAYESCYEAACQVLGMNAEAPEDPDKLYTYLRRYLTQIQAEYNRLDSDSAWIHWDWAEPDTIGAEHSGKSLDPQKVLQAIEEVHITALKALPTTLGRQWGQALSTTGSVEHQLFILTAESLRSVLHSWASWVGTQWLRIQGIAAYCVVDQPPLSKEDEAAASSALLARVQAYVLAQQQGWIDSDKAAQDIFKLPAASGAPMVTEAAAARKVQVGGHDGAVGAGKRHGDGLPMHPSVSWATREGGLDDVPAAERKVTEADVNEAVADFYTWARANRPELKGLLDADQEEAQGSSRRWLEDQLVNRAGHQLQRNGNGHQPAGGVPPFAEATRTQLKVRVADLLQQGLDNGQVARTLLAGVRDIDKDGDAEGWRYNRRTHQFRTPDGRFASQGQVRDWMEEYQQNVGERMQATTRRYMQGDISEDTWRGNMRQLLRNGHLTARTMAVGGRKVMEDGDLRAVNVAYQSDLRALRRFAAGIRDGSVTEGQAVFRAGMYAQSNMRDTFDAGVRTVRGEDGWEQGRRVLSGGAAHCMTCLTEAAAGWVPIASLGNIGATDCNGNDKCRMEYRYSPASAVPSRQAWVERTQARDGQGAGQVRAQGPALYLGNMLLA